MEHADFSNAWISLILSQIPMLAWTNQCTHFHQNHISHEKTRLHNLKFTIHLIFFDFDLCQFYSFTDPNFLHKQSLSLPAEAAAD